MTVAVPTRAKSLFGRVARVPQRIRRAASPGAVILLYHRIARSGADPHRLCVSPEHFAEHLEVVRRVGRPMPLRELVQRIRNRQSIRRAVVLTFDDGYADNVETAAPLLRTHGVPATLFVASGAVGSAREFAWDELARLLLECDSPRGRLHERLHLRLRRMSAVARERLLDRLAERRGVERPAARGTHRTLSPAEMGQLARDPLIEIGSHTVTHPLLAALPPDEQAVELQRSRAALEELADGPVTSFSYPFGGPRDYTRDSVKAVRAAGYECACTNFFAPVRWSTDLLQLPRLMVPDTSGEQLERDLRWLAFA
jgi:peptidoglycan/xylan/chitin deacetylase (PgdA/CDA1 family)